MTGCFSVCAHARFMCTGAAAVMPEKCQNTLTLQSPPRLCLPTSQATTNFVPDSNGQVNVRTVESNVNKSSRYRGVYWDNNKQLWRAGIGHQGKQHFLGYFRDQVDAAVAYDAAATMFGGPHVLNFPDQVYMPI